MVQSIHYADIDPPAHFKPHVSSNEEHIFYWYNAVTDTLFKIGLFFEWLNYSSSSVWTLETCRASYVYEELRNIRELMGLAPGRFTRLCISAFIFIGAIKARRRVITWL